MKIIPLDNYLLLKVCKVKAVGGIVMPEQHQQEDEIAEVIAWGTKVEKAWHHGDRVLCINGSGQPTINKELVLIREDNIIGLVKEGT